MVDSLGVTNWNKLLGALTGYPLLTWPPVSGILELLRTHVTGAVLLRLVVNNPNICAAPVSPKQAHERTGVRIFAFAVR